MMGERPRESRGRGSPRPRYLQLPAPDSGLFGDVAPGRVWRVALPDGEEGEAGLRLSVGRRLVRDDGADRNAEVAARRDETALRAPMDLGRAFILEISDHGVEPVGEAGARIHVHRVLAAILAKGGLEAHDLR